MSLFRIGILSFILGCTLFYIIGYIFLFKCLAIVLSSQIRLLGKFAFLGDMADGDQEVILLQVFANVTSQQVKMAHAFHCKAVSMACESLIIAI
ncbi:hypothetical protein GDO81_023237 [Engystomops pustulosus]|uniref:Uncharacterized protein n=1 Tax=Engystomops pustulosus TaxID=76066 RepID=A0AAV6ZCM9_ENGPU|nr:hypothetical protein GDO81_023237 [Engystomops pustulosus]